MTAFGNTASVITYNVIFNHAGTKDVTKQHFGKILLRKLSVSGEISKIGECWIEIGRVCFELAFYC